MYDEYWNDFRNELLSYLDNLIIKDAKWIYDAQFIAITANVLNKHVILRDIDLLKISKGGKNDNNIEIIPSQSRSSLVNTSATVHQRYTDDKFNLPSKQKIELESYNI